jgi:hypothetical protein
VRVLQTSPKTKSQPASQRDARSVAEYRALSSSKIAERIENEVVGRMVARAEEGRGAGLFEDEAEAMGAAHLLRRCAHEDNLWRSKGLTSKTGDKFDGVGTLYSCNVRLCPFWMNARQKISRRRAREGMARVELERNEQWDLVTLTAPTLPASRVSLQETIRVINEAWHLFTKDGAWKVFSRASIKGVEFTLGDQRCDKHREEKKDRRSKDCRECEDCREWDAERDGYHVHIHLLTVSTGIVNKDGLRAAWTTYLERAWKNNKIDQGINTRDGFAVCNARYVTNNKVKKTKHLISRDEAVFEVAKYITKTESFLDIPAAQLIEVASARRWSRMFEVIGHCRKERKKEGEQKKDEQATLEDAKRCLDTDSLSSEILSSAEANRLSDLKEALRVVRARPRPRKLPSASMRSLAVMRLLAGEWEKLALELDARVADVRSYRRAQLARVYPAAIFETFSGNTWSAASASVTVEMMENNAIWRESVEAEFPPPSSLERRFAAAKSERDERLNWVDGRKREGDERANWSKRNAILAREGDEIDERDERESKTRARARTKWVDDWEVTNEQKIIRAALLATLTRQEAE